MREQTFPQLMTVAEVGFALRMTPQSVRKLVHSGDLPAVRRGGHNAALLVPRAALEEFLFCAPTDEDRCRRP
jgi:excisionase family DNA binding protein